MGVKGLWSLLNPVARPVQIQSMEGKRLAIDSSIWLYQFQATMRDKDGRVLVNAHVLGFLRRINKLLFHGIKPVFVFDGGAPALKRSTIAERKRRKAGAAQNHARVAEKLFAAQMRREAVKAAQAAEEARAARAAARMTYNVEVGDEILEGATYLEDLERLPGRPGPSSFRRQPDPTSTSESREKSPLTEAEKRRRKFKNHDPYRLPETTIPTVSTEERPDARLATEAELQQFIDDVHPEDIDVESAEFRALPTEVQYEIIGDLRSRSRQQSHKRLTDMLRAAPTALDFSKAQIKHLSQRNALTQQLLTVTDMVGKAHLTIPVRIAAERNREYVLVKRGEDEGGGWALGIRDGTKDKPIVLEPEDAEEDLKSDPDDESMIDDDVESGNGRLDIDDVTPPPQLIDHDLREHRRRQILEAITARYAPTPKAASKPSLDVTSKPFGRSRTTYGRTLLDMDMATGANATTDDANISMEEDALVPTANDEALALALQQEELGSDEDVPDPALARALALSRRDAERGHMGATTHDEDEEDSDVSLEEVSLVPSGRSTPIPLSAVNSVIVVSDEEDEEDEDFFEVVEASQTIEPLQMIGAAQVVEASPVEMSAVAEVVVDRQVHNGRSFEQSEALEKLIRESLAPVPPPPTPSTTLASVPPPAIAVQPLSEPRAFAARPENVTLDKSDEDDDDEFEVVGIRPSAPVKTDAQNISIEASQPTVVPPGEPPGPESADVAAVPAGGYPNDSSVPPDSPVSTGYESTQLNERERAIESTQYLESTLPNSPQSSDGDSDEDGEDSRSIEWSRSPSPRVRSHTRPQLTAEDSGRSIMSESDFAEADAGGEDGDNIDDGGMAPGDMVAEEDDYARFMAQIKNRDLNEVRTEIDDEIRVLNAQTKVALRDSDEITQSMVSQIQTLLRHFGIPYITAPMEAEAQCAKLAELGLVDGIITDDSDVFLFGGTQCFKNIFNDAKYAECFLASDVERELSLTRERLISLAYLLGSDYTIGLPGVGPVVALELLANFPGQGGLDRFKEWWLKVQRGQDLPVESDTKWKRSFKKRFSGSIYLLADWPNPLVRDAYLYPTADESEEPFHWGFPRLAALRTFLHEELSWSISKVDDELTPIVQRIAKRGRGGSLNTQTTLDPFFDSSAGTANYAAAPRKRRTANVSKRLMAVIKEYRDAEARAQGHEQPPDWGQMMAAVDEDDPKGRKATAASRTQSLGDSGSDDVRGSTAGDRQQVETLVRGRSTGRGGGRGRGGVTGKRSRATSSASAAVSVSGSPAPSESSEGRRVRRRGMKELKR